MSMQSNRLISGYLGLNPTPWSPADGIVLSNAIFHQVTDWINHDFTRRPFAKAFAQAAFEPTRDQCLVVRDIPDL